MTEFQQLIQNMLIIPQIYLAAGVVFGIYLLGWGLPVLDKSAKGSSFWLRLLLLPGTVVLWIFILPVLLRKK